MTPTLAAEPVDLADLIRSGSSDQHKSTENRTFITQLMRGELSLEDYTRYLAQYAWVYEALEALVAKIDGYPLFDTRLNRLASIESDLTALGAAEWRVTNAPLPATAAYVAHLNSLGTNDGISCLAHHYTRYLGDLSGGQAISRLVARHYGATPEQLSFYNFTEIDDIVHYKRAYRQGMNTLSLGQDEIDELVSEVDAAFTFNGAIFDELAG
ncbi:heme oxygenase (biliverdin-producing) [Leifsonia sp. A12D58]|uniref:biliverdin-producing heme oxygenase n=1 Tax=Leifsonia sp. A12D58 TaxID=3397674 RepID=UPI0039E1AD12